MPLRDKRANAALAAGARKSRKAAMPTIAGVKAKGRLINKHVVMHLVGMSYPAIWSAMRAGTFPLSVKTGGKAMWFEDEVAAWMASLPRSALKGSD